MEAVERFTDPLSAAKHIVQEAFRTWLRYEVRTDDITIIVLFIEDFDEGTNAEVCKLPKRHVSLQPHAKTIRSNILDAVCFTTSRSPRQAGLSANTENQPLTNDGPNPFETLAPCCSICVRFFLGN